MPLEPIALLNTVEISLSDYAKAQAFIEMGMNRMTAGKQTEAREMFLAASKAGQQIIPDLDPRGRAMRSGKDSTLRVIAWEQAKAGDVEEALKTAETISTAHELDTAFGGIAPAQAKAGDKKGALETIGRIKDETWKAAALEGVAEKLVRTGHEKDAVDLAAKQASPAHKAYALLGVVLGKTKVKAPEE